MEGGGGSERLSAVRENRERLYEGIVGLERSLAAPSGLKERWLDGVRAALEHLQRTLEDHIKVTEEEGGLFEDIIASAPRLSNAVERLRQEHVEFRHEIEAWLTALDSAEELRPKEVRGSLTSLLAALAGHRQAGSDLIYEAYERDVGALD